MFNANILQAVQTYQASSLGILQNLYAGIATFNKRFRDFNKLTANLGDTVTFDLPPRMVAQVGSLSVSQWESVQQRVQSLTVAYPVLVPFAFTAQELIFNIDNNDYRMKLEESAMAALGAQLESAVLTSITGSSTSIGGTSSGPYRFYGDGVTPINSFGQLASALAYFRNFSAVNASTKGYLSDLAVPSIANSGLQQFATNRNNELANDWELGPFSNCDWYQSNYLPQWISGTVGQNGDTLTVSSISADGTTLTCTGAGTSDTIVAGDLLQFQDNVSGQPNLRYLTFTGYQPSGNPVQVRATSNATASTGTITFTVFPALISTAGNVNQNIPSTTPIASGMQLKALPNHRRGFLSSGDACFLGMPQLPDQYPYPTANKADDESGAAIRFTYGSIFGQNQTGFIYDSIIGATVVPEYTMALIFPLSQG